MKTLYKILEIEETATAEEIKKAYYKKAKEHHPDSNIDKNWTAEEIHEHEAIFNKIKHAYDVLKDEDSRKKYDKKLQEKRDKKEQQKRQQEREEAMKREEEARKAAEAEEELRQARAQRVAKQREEARRASSTYSSSDYASYYDDCYDDFDFYDEYDDYSFDREAHTQEKSTFKERWDERNTDFAKEYAKTHDDIPRDLSGVIALITKAGIINISGEMIYQLSRFKETEAGKFMTKYKSAAIGIALTAVLATTGFSTLSKAKSDSDKALNLTSETSISQQEEIQSRITLTRMYTIKAGDTLSGIAENASTTMNRLQEINNIKTASIIRMGATIEVPYNISKEDEEYYTETIAVEDMSLEDIATKYETTVETLKTLNEESINYLSDDSYIILSDTLVVPKFPTIKEVDAMKEYKTK